MNNKLDIVKKELESQGITDFEPKTSKSTKWLEWIVVFTPTTCKTCANKYGKLISIYDTSESTPKLHINCRCFLQFIISILRGTATIHGLYGADAWVKNYGELPSNYVDKDTAEKKGWNDTKGNLREIISNATIGGDIFENRKKKLPDSDGRIWYEADINYTGGYRNAHRLLYSNDGLIFVTYDHYETFCEII